MCDSPTELNNIVPGSCDERSNMSARNTCHLPLDSSFVTDLENGAQ